MNASGRSAVRRRIPRPLGLVAVLTAVLAGFMITLAGAAPAHAATSKVLDYDFQWQQNGYYCGPAATRIALTARGYTYTQSQLAAQLHTDENGTDSAADTTRVLNAQGHTAWYETKWIGGSTATSAQKALLKSDVLLDIDKGYPLVTNVVGTVTDTDGDTHSYPGGHYVAVVGYVDSGNTVRIADPADANGYGWYSVTTSRMADWIAGRGYSA